MAFFGLIGNDRHMADTAYSGRESASEKASRLRRAAHHRAAAAADRQGQAWEDRERRRQDHSARWRTP
ncbi:hypothetical protein [Streptomyces clavuligerus]|uniref:Uncharacterized protein n=1 Tax=Streptomyces clavuligerus TaxID=1901 RepID=B5GUN4_STRCL|nr:hypothetical protein [Streptomyces clavuligerus]EDY50030.1 hypothetical protein SSCG_03284 [Streptomyces clavuligerus]EFG03738.1 Hypothetical protein SCLAV_p0247 [Streptomyces clavuligerus]MBY6307722.1 hypothetical protein [Streptomyces clavuligerus]QCS09728.1 hypothetical protein CRV15_29345 [Streptomyces clavuligerus]QPJ98226.1 hypothetical protein GE265_35045 [Streptomyces clavuligerus]